MTFHELRNVFFGCPGTSQDKLAFVLLNNAAFPEAVKKYKVTSFPHLVVVRKDKKDEIYKGAFEFQKLFDWLNVFSETFVMGGGFSDAAPPAEFDPELQPWYFNTSMCATTYFRGLSRRY